MQARLQISAATRGVTQHSVWLAPYLRVNQSTDIRDQSDAERGGRARKEACAGCTKLARVNHRQSWTNCQTIEAAQIKFAQTQIGLYGCYLWHDHELRDFQACWSRVQTHHWDSKPTQASAVQGHYHKRQQIQKPRVGSCNTWHSGRIRLDSRIDYAKTRESSFTLKYQARRSAESFLTRVSWVPSPRQTREALKSNQTTNRNKKLNVGA